MAGSNSQTQIPTAPERRVHLSDELDGRIRQAEVISNVVQVVGFDQAAKAVDTIVHKFAIVSTQDCDLETDHRSRQEQIIRGRLNGALLFEAHIYDEAFRKSLGGRDLWKRVNNNKDERYHVFDKVPAGVDLCGEGLPELVIDFKRYFTLTPLDLESQIENGTATRRCRVATPFLESFAQRAAHFMSRVAVPER